MKPKENMEIGKQLSFALYGAANRMNRLHKPFLDPLGLTFPQYLVMLELFCGTPRAVGELGNKLDMDTGTITPLLKRLEASGKVKRTRDPADERRVLITLTEAGDALQEELWCITDKIKTACRLSEEGLAQLRDTLNALSHPASDQAAYKYTVSKELIMKIGIIGAGNIGATLAGKLSAGGHEIKLANSRGPDSIRDLARKVGATAVTREEAVKDVDAIILAIPFEKHRGLANLFSQVPESVVVIDTSNYYPFRDSAIAEVDNGKPESVWASEQTGRQLVKAWNAALAATLADKGLPSGAPGRIALPVAGDDAQAKAVVLKLVSETGFDALDAGPLSESWRQQPGTPAYCTELDINELKKALSAADAARAPKNRDELIKVFMTPDAHFAHEEVIARNREVTA